MTNKKCRRCGTRVEVETVIEEYPYYCPECDENMYSFEVEEILEIVRHDESYGIMGEAAGYENFEIGDIVEARWGNDTTVGLLVKDEDFSFIMGWKSAGLTGLDSIKVIKPSHLVTSKDIKEIHDFFDLKKVDF